MNYVFKAVLRNGQHPENGVVTIPFPIPREEYDYVVELLRGMDIGDPVKRDCHLGGIDSYYSVLNRMVDLPQNLDELDYLAKRLDSFSEGEDAQFQAMAHTAADCFWDQDGSGSWERYEDVLLLSMDFLNDSPDTLPEWAPMIREAQSFYTQQEDLHYTHLGIQERTNRTGEMNFK